MRPKLRAAVTLRCVGEDLTSGTTSAAATVSACGVPHPCKPYSRFRVHGTGRAGLNHPLLQIFTIIQTFLAFCPLCISSLHYPTSNVSISPLAAKHTIQSLLHACSWLVRPSRLVQRISSQFDSSLTTSAPPPPLPFVVHIRSSHLSSAHFTQPRHLNTLYNLDHSSVPNRHPPPHPLPTCSRSVCSTKDITLSSTTCSEEDIPAGVLR